MLHQVEAGLGGVVAQRAAIDARVRTVRAVLLLQVLRIRGDGVLGAFKGQNQAKFLSRKNAFTALSLSFVIYGHRIFLFRALFAFKTVKNKMAARVMVVHLHFVAVAPCEKTHGCSKYTNPLYNNKDLKKKSIRDFQINQIHFRQR